MANTSNHPINLSNFKVPIEYIFNGQNFKYWFKYLVKILERFGKVYVIECPVLDRPDPKATKESRDAFLKHVQDVLDVKCFLRNSMSQELVEYYGLLEPCEIVDDLKKRFLQKDNQHRFDMVKGLFQCKMAKDSSAAPHALDLIEYAEELAVMGMPLDQELIQYLILQSLPDEYSHFMKDYIQHGNGKSLPDLLNLLEAYEAGIKQSESAIASNVDARIGKRKANTSKNDQCNHCGKFGHWKRNCPKYLEEVKQNKSVGAATSGIYVIEINYSDPNSWVLDTVCGSHICKNMQALKRTRMLTKDEVDLHFVNEARVAALAVGTLSLFLPTGHVIELVNCYYVPIICRNIISVSCLDKAGYSFIIKNNCCSIFMNDVSCLDKAGYSFIIKNNCCSIFMNDVFCVKANLSNGLLCIGY